MGIKETLKRSETAVGLIRDSRKIVSKIQGGISKAAHGERIRKQYLTKHEVKKLQLGAGPTSLNGWLSTDIVPEGDEVAYLDASQRFPFEDQTFDYIYSEHMIEHIPWHDGLVMLRECRRVLKPDGTVRVATPDLEVILGLYSCESRDLMQEKYIKWITDRYLTGIKVYKPSFVINNAFRNWGHQFLYDAELLKMAMHEAGLVDLKRYAPGCSDDENLRAIESHGKNVDDNAMGYFETLVIEGRCPSH